MVSLRHEQHSRNNTINNNDDDLRYSETLDIPVFLTLQAVELSMPVSLSRSSGSFLTEAPQSVLSAVVLSDISTSSKTSQILWCLRSLVV